MFVCLLFDYVNNVPSSNTGNAAGTRLIKGCNTICSIK